jgi:tetraacyldisaccharide 4'-kinase
MRFVKFVGAVVYGVITRARGLLFDFKVLRTYRSSVPVVSVGNITAGGNGKTPLCLLIARELWNRGYRPAILSRGYGGRIRGPHRVSAKDSARDVGDEPVLMAESGIPVYVARKRVEGARFIESEGVADVIILDDGLQHRALARDVDIVSIFAGSEQAIQSFAKGELLPLGMFREDRDRAIRRASLFVVSQRSVLEEGKVPEVDPRLLQLLPRSGVVFRAYLEAQGVYSMMDGASVAVQPVCACAAIANPEGFFQSLERLGFQVHERIGFPDHHDFSEAEIRALLQRYPLEQFVCTEKDAVKLRGLGDAVKKRFAVLRVSARVVPHDAFFVRIERLMQGLR